MPRHSRPYAAYNLSPIPFSAFPCPASLLNHTPHPLIQPHYPRSLLFIPPHIPLSHILTSPQSFPSLKTLARHSPTPTHTHPPSPFPTIYTSSHLSSTPLHTPQLITTHIFALMNRCGLGRAIPRSGFTRASRIENRPPSRYCRTPSEPVGGFRAVPLVNIITNNATQ